MDNHQAILPSPGFNIHVYFHLFRGNPYYLAYYKKRKILEWSLMGFNPAGVPSYSESMIYDDDTEKFTIPSPGIQPAFFNDLKFNELSVFLRSGIKPESGYIIDFRAFDDGFAFRYRFYSRDETEELMPHESSEFNFNGSGGNWDPISQPDSLYLTEDVYSLPVDLASDDHMAVRIFETTGEDGSSLKLKQDKQNASAFSVFFDEGGSVAADYFTEQATPWRVILISNKTSYEQE